MKRLACLIALSALLALPASAVAAACPRTSLSAVENDVMCLQCGTPLSVSEDAPAAQRERVLIEQLVAQCRSKSQVENALVAQYGDRVLALPRARGFALSAYLVPAGGLLAGLVLVLLLVLRWRRTRLAPRATPSVAPATGDSAEARLEADLKRYRL